VVCRRRASCSGAKRREQVFDGLEAVARGGLEVAVEKVQVVVEHGQVGGEAGHEAFLKTDA
jgi:hypothetical protein